MRREAEDDALAAARGRAETGQQVAVAWGVVGQAIRVRDRDLVGRLQRGIEHVQQGFFAGRSHGPGAVRPRYQRVGIIRQGGACGLVAGRSIQGHQVALRAVAVIQRDNLRFIGREAIKLAGRLPHRGAAGRQVRQSICGQSPRPGNVERAAIGAQRRILRIGQERGEHPLVRVHAPQLPALGIHEQKLAGRREEQPAQPSGGSRIEPDDAQHLSISQIDDRDDGAALRGVGMIDVRSAARRIHDRAQRVVGVACGHPDIERRRFLGWDDRRLAGSLARRRPRPDQGQDQDHQENGTPHLHTLPPTQPARSSLTPLSQAIISPLVMPSRPAISCSIERAAAR